MQSAQLLTPNLSGHGFESRVAHAQTTRGTVATNYAEVTSVAGIVPFQESSHLSLLKMTMSLSTNSLL